VAFFILPCFKVKVFFKIFARINSIARQNRVALDFWAAAMYLDTVPQHSRCGFCCYSEFERRNINVALRR